MTLECLPAAIDGVVSAYAALSQVQAVVLGGSRATGVWDEESDWDLYVYVRESIPLAQRAAVARADAAEVGNLFWEEGDEWIDRESGCHLDATFRQTRWIEEQLDR